MLDCIVIGAGPGGLVTTKELLEQGVREVVCLEKTADVGGVFANTYDSLVLTTSCTYSMFSDFWIGDGNQHNFWTKNEAVNYWKRYAKHFGVLDKIRFNSQVEAVTPQDDGGWQVQLASGETLVSKRVAVANGNNTYPKYPQWKESLTDVDFCHSQKYRNPEGFVGKNVLVVGGGESASEITLEISRVAKSCWVSIRNSTGFVVPRKRSGRANDIDVSRVLYKLPREYGYTLLKIVSRQWLSYKNPVDATGVKLNEKIQSKYGVWGTYGTKTFALPTAIANHGCQVVGEIIRVEDGGQTLICANGETLKNVDAVVFATGYKNHVSFLPDELKETDLRSLYKHMFHPQYREKIVWIGRARPSFGSQFPVMEMQARLFALICTGEKKLPASAQMEQVALLDREKYSEQFAFKSGKSFRSLVDYHFYMDNLAEIVGCKPPLWQYFFLHPQLWLRMVYGATQGTQFRLRGPGQKKALAQELIAKLPVAPFFNPFFKYIFIAAVKARIFYGLKAVFRGLTSWKKIGFWQPQFNERSREISR
ncbi:MAG: NAD(P)-binding domain-containing protein [Cyanobacteriota bacterium]|nr:NAD(P)-binding domain-containing protein [Cyanobacteriota bacterium]